MKLALLWAAGAALLPAQEPDSQPLFDGKTLRGWTPRGEGVFSVDGGTLLGVTGGGGYGWLCTDKTYGDFVLELDVKVEGTGNSGVQVRSRLDEKGVMIGYQFDVDRTRPSSGRLYDEARRKLLQDVPLDPECRNALKPEEWNRIRIECRADHLRSWVNGVAIVDYLDPVDLEGIIALQVHSGKDVRMRWRDIRVQDLGRRSWKPWGDGKSLAGWRPSGKGAWSAEGGAIVGRHSRQDPEPGYLVSEAARQDFSVRLKVKFEKGSGAVSVRAAEPASGGVTGPRAEIARAKPFKPGEWNEVAVSARGPRVVVHVNGWKASEISDPDRRPGKVALEVQGGEEGVVSFKDVEVLE